MKPLKLVLKLIYYLLVGGVVLVVVNLIGGLFNFQIGLNPVSALTVGILGVPGLSLLVVLKILFKI